MQKRHPKGALSNQAELVRDLINAICPTPDRISFR